MHKGFPFLKGVCVCACARARMCVLHVQTRKFMGEDVWRPEADISCHPLWLAISYFAAGSLSEPGEPTDSARSASQQAPRPPPAPSPVLELQACHYAWLFHECEALNSSPHALSASNLPAKPPLHPAL